MKKLMLVLSLCGGVLAAVSNVNAASTVRCQHAGEPYTTFYCVSDPGSSDVYWHGNTNGLNTKTTCNETTKVEVVGRNKGALKSYCNQGTIRW